MLIHLCNLCISSNLLKNPDGNNPSKLCNYCELNNGSEIIMEQYEKYNCIIILLDKFIFEHLNLKFHKESASF